MKILVVGCERSGTTIISSLLSKASGLSYLNDPPDSWYIYPLVRLIGVKGFTFDLIFRIWKYDIIKIPGFATILPQLKRIHPKKFKVIYIIRDPRDTFAAIKERLKEDFNGLYINTHFLKVKGKSVCENIGLRWVKYLESAKLFETQHPKDIMFIRYEDFLEDKTKVLNLIAEFTSMKIDLSLIKEDMENQANKSWSNKIEGAGRYIRDLEPEETQKINEIAKKGMKEYNYE
ncbi:MAG: sulfotransferase family protein [Bacteroidota bacterium]